MQKIVVDIQIYEIVPTNCHPLSIGEEMLNYFFWVTQLRSDKSQDLDRGQGDCRAHILKSFIILLPEIFIIWNQNPTVAHANFTFN